MPDYTIDDPEAEAARIAAARARLDRGPGHHMWVWLGVWYVANPREMEVNLDRENLINLAGPGCYKCDQPYSNRLAKQPCRGADVT
jgi:hypothetical protein